MLKIPDILKKTKKVKKEDFEELVEAFQALKHHKVLPDNFEIDPISICVSNLIDLICEFLTKKIINFGEILKTEI